MLISQFESIPKYTVLYEQFLVIKGFNYEKMKNQLF